VNRKVLVFTAFADTASYLYQNLHEWALKELGIQSALVVGTGENKTTFQPPGFTRLTEYNHILTNFSPISKRRKKMSLMPQEGEIDLLIATDCISEGQNLQDCDYLVNYDIHWNPVRIIQRFGRIDRIGSLNPTVQLVNFWPTPNLDQYISLKHRVEARMALVDIAATLEDNLLQREELQDLITDDLRYRDRQLLRLKEEVLDLEDLEESISLTEFTLDDFRIDLLKYLEANRSALEAAPFGLYTVVPPHSQIKTITPGVIWCLKQVKQTILSAPSHDGGQTGLCQTELSGSPVQKGSGQTGLSGSPLKPFNPEAEIVRTHRHLPHWFQEGCTYFVTFRLADSLPQEKLNAWTTERDVWLKFHPKPWIDSTWEEYQDRFGERFEGWLDAGYGGCALAQPEVRAVIENCLKHFDGQRYDLGDYVIMPNHVHILLCPKDGYSLSEILKGMKGVSANQCNKLLGRTGTFWMDESFDHIVRNTIQLEKYQKYIWDNPAKAGLKQGYYTVKQTILSAPFHDGSQTKLSGSPGKTELRQTGLSASQSQVNPLQPYFLVYVMDDGNVRLGFAHPKQILGVYRELCIGKSTAYDNLCTLFDQETSDGRNTILYDKLLNKAVESIIATFRKRVAAGLQSGRSFKIPDQNEQANDTTDFDLVTWLVIKKI